jgi:hypothetical protein
MEGIGGLEIIILLIVAGLYSLFVFYCTKTAVKFNRNKIIWTILGILNPVIAIILLYIIGRKK